MTNSEEFDHPDDDVAEEDNKHEDSGESDKQSVTEYKDPTKYGKDLKKSKLKQYERLATHPYWGHKDLQKNQNSIFIVFLNENLFQN